MANAGSRLEFEKVAESIRLLCPRTPTDPRVLETIRQLEQMLRDKPSTNECAQQAGLSRSRLCHLFRANTGWSVSQYARQVRLSVGRHLVESSRMSVKEVAAQVGVHPTHFSRDFRRAFGLSPREYRLSVRGQSADG